MDKSKQNSKNWNTIEKKINNEKHFEKQKEKQEKVGIMEHHWLDDDFWVLKKRESRRIFYMNWGQ